MAKIDFISAENGGIKFYGGKDDTAMTLNPVGFAKTPDMVAYILQTRGTADNLDHSSSMDFADEYGFETADGAMTMYREAIKLSGV